MKKDNEEEVTEQKHQFNRLIRVQWMTEEKPNQIQYKRWSNKQCVKLQDSVNNFTIAYHSLPQSTMAQWLNAAR